MVLFLFFHTILTPSQKMRGGFCFVIKIILFFKERSVSDEKSRCGSEVV